jgi:hypothetical protein
VWLVARALEPGGKSINTLLPPFAILSSFLPFNISASTRHTKAGRARLLSY